MILQPPSRPFSWVLCGDSRVDLFHIHISRKETINSALAWSPEFRHVPAPPSPTAFFL